MMSQTALLHERRLLETGFSIGICAADSASNLNRLLALIENESYPQNLMLKKVILVASGCDPTAVTHAKEVANRDRRIVIIEEPTRRGKASAINQIMTNYEGQFLVLVNSDALPEAGAISTLLREIAKDDKVGMVSASPLVNGEDSVANSVLQLIWGVHNECLLRLSDSHRNNHCCDELIVVRSVALHTLPPNTVNDGAYLAGAAYRAGYSIKFSEAARVAIDLPNRFVDIIRQRRRIVFGHFQIWKSVGESPRTLESMLLEDPMQSLSILIKTLARSPNLILVLPVAVTSELISIFLAVYDNLRWTDRHITWQRFGSRS
jgi:cellulose synthase/poly-beta-1,6-N-acetylglucosamine synthase-like glycosyltransferase